MREAKAAQPTASSFNGHWRAWALSLFVAITFVLGSCIGSSAAADLSGVEMRLRSVEVRLTRVETKLEALDRIERFMERATK